MKIQFLGTPDDEPYLFHLSDALGKYKHDASANLRKMEYISEIVTLYKSQGVTHIITTQEHLISKLCSTASSSEQKLNNYAGSLIHHDSGLIFLFINPLKQCVTIPYGKFLLTRYVAKITNPSIYLNVPKFSWHLMESPAEYNSLLSLLNHKDAIATAVDIETRKDLSISSVSYTVILISPDNKLSLITKVMPLPYGLDLEDYELRFYYLKEFNNTAIPKIFQNGKYDCAYFQYYNVPVRSYLWDTQILATSAYCELPKDLAMIGAFYIKDYLFWKNEGDSGNLMDLYYYNALDTYGTAVAFLQWMKDFALPSNKDTYAVNNYLLTFPTIHPNFLMESTGLAANIDILNEVLAEKEAVKQQALENIRASLGEPNYNPASPVQTKAILNCLGCKDLKKADEKSLNRAAFRHPFNHYIIHLIIEYRKAAKLISTYLNPEKLFKDRFLYSLTPVTDTGRNRSGEHAFWTGCMPTDKAMAYTPNGWVAIKDRPPVIAQYSWDGTIEFVEASWNMYHVTNETLYSYYARSISGDFTAGHNVPIVKPNRPNRFTTWLDLYQATGTRYTINSGIINNSSCRPDITDNWLQIFVMLSADGSRESRISWRVSFSKQRKIDRCLLLTNLTLADAQRRSDRSDVFRFKIMESAIEPYSKVFPSWFTELDLHQRRVIINELMYWDGHQRGNSFRYYSTIRENVDLVVTLCHISGFSASISYNHDNNRGYGSGNNKTLYTVNISQKTVSAIDSNKITKVNFTGEVGCPSVPSRMWLVKYGDKIHVTGNSNIQNIPRAGGIKRYLGTYPGFKLYESDFAQAESRDTAYITGDTVLIDAVESDKDFHKHNASMFFGVPYDDVDKELRQLGKPVNHGANYLMSNDTLIDSMGLPNVFKAADRLGLPKTFTALNITKHLLSLFAKTYKVVSSDYPKYIQHEVRNRGRLTNPYGFTRICFGDPIKSRQYLRALVAFLPQGTNAQALNKAVVRVFYDIWKQGDNSDNLLIHAQIHDSLLYSLREGHEYLQDQIELLMYESSKVNVTDISGITRQLHVPVDKAKPGFQWADSKD